jgi:hypothetical protein
VNLKAALSALGGQAFGHSSETELIAWLKANPKSPAGVASNQFRLVTASFQKQEA